MKGTCKRNTPQQGLGCPREDPSDIRIFDTRVVIWRRGRRERLSHTPHRLHDLTVCCSACYRFRFSCHYSMAPCMMLNCYDSSLYASPTLLLSVIVVINVNVVPRPPGGSKKIDPLIWYPNYERVLYRNSCKGSIFWILPAVWVSSTAI